MPELPEVETTLRAIKKFKNSTIKESKFIIGILDGK